MDVQIVFYNIILYAIVQVNGAQTYFGWPYATQKRNISISA